MSFIASRKPEPVAFYEGDGLTLKGVGKWRSALCPFHDDGEPSMRINLDSGGFVCMSCGTKGGDVIAYAMQRYGIEFIDAAKLLGCWVEDGKTSKHKPLPFSMRSAVEVVRAETLLVAVAACNVAAGVALSAADKERLIEAASRIEFIAGAVLG